MVIKTYFYEVIFPKDFTFQDSVAEQSTDDIAALTHVAT
jgi:hypothetical protein